LLTFKNSISLYDRTITAPAYRFKGNQVSSFTEATYTVKNDKTDWVAGINLLTDRFSEEPTGTNAVRDYTQNTWGLFVQNTWNVNERIIVESGLRGDHVREYGIAVLPRISFLFKISPKLTSRIGAGFGYKAPSIFTEETEKLLFRNILPVNAKDNVLEKSYGLNADLNFRSSAGPVNLSVNQFFFYTAINRALLLSTGLNGMNSLQNIQGRISSKGAETNIKVSYHELALYMGYTFTDTKIPLTPKHRFNQALVYEIEGKWKFGSELYYYSTQTRNDGSIGRSYWLAGFLAEKLWKNISVYLNFENLANVKQTDFEKIYTGTITNPNFKDIYAPLEGFVVNGGIRIKL
jgi:iron complex outermembrane receptor protein